MKLGPITISLAQPKAAPKPNLDEVGGTGTSVTPIAGGGGQASRMQLTQQDYNADLAYPQAYDVYDRMRLSDGTVGGLLKAIKLPLLGAEWKVEPASESAEDVEIADFVDSDLHAMTTSLEETLRLVLLMLDYGSMVFEKVWEMRDDNRVHLRKLAQRLPKSIIRWDVDEGGGLANVRQQVMKDGTFKQIDIPVEKLAVFVNEREGANWRGTSILRNAYKHHYYLDHFYAIDAIAKQRRGAGVDVGRIKEGAADKKAVKTAVERVLMGLNVHEKQFVTEAEDEWEYRIESIGGNLPRMMESIEHHVNMILRSVLASFLGLSATSGSASLALSKDQSGFFLMALRAVGSNIEHTFSEYVIKPLVDYNFPNVKTYPQLKHGRLETRNVTEFASAVASLMTAGALTPGADVEASSREVLELPEQQDGEAVYAAKDAAAKAAADAAAKIAAQPPADPTKEPTPIRKAMSYRVELAQPALSPRARRLQALTAAQLAELADRLRDEEDDLDEEEFVEKGHGLLKAAYLTAFLLGVGKVVANRPVQRTKAESWAFSEADTQRAFLKGYATDLVSGQVSLAQADARAGLYAGKVWTGFERGRAAVAPDGSRIIWHTDDDNACDLCDPRDGVEFTHDGLPGFPGDGDFGEICEGAANCRCWLEYVAAQEGA